MRLFYIFLIFLTGLGAHAQKKSVTALKVNTPIQIDGNLDEEVWFEAQLATDFVMFEPDNDKPLPFEKRSEIRILYDNEGIYIGAIHYDNQPNLIMREFTQRDNFGVSDHFGVYINGFNDGQQDFRFFVSTAGVQMDCLATEFREDYTWDAIWESAVKITDFGWTVEMMIPYAALRFPPIEVQEWGLNFMRELRRDRQRYAWSPIDARIGAVIPQAGVLKGIRDIKPPVRLFLIPYASTYMQKSESTFQDTYKAGMDIKYGINDAFTLDAILIPDFGQAAFDDVILNLSPFEQQFNENRPFFSEGTDIFNRGGLLYTRRIGGSPSRRARPQENEEVTYSPSTVNLMNATKISGRTQKGLGVGVLNAITEPTYARLTNTETGETRRELVESLTNYNVTVFDQRFRGNSSVTFVNTNVLRSGDFRDANVSALVFDLNTKENTYNLSGDFKYSNVQSFQNRQGYSTMLNFGRTFSKHRFNVRGLYVSKDYEINDLGINFMTNYHSVRANYNYRILNPVGPFNTLRVNTNIYSEIHNGTGMIQQAWQNIIVQGTTKQNDFFLAAIYTNPFQTYDFYESRIDGQWLNFPRSNGGWMYFSTNYNRKWAIDFEPSYRKYAQTNREDLSIMISPRYRFTDRWSMIYSFDYFHQNSDIGWVDFFEDQTILAERNRVTLTNSLRGRFSLNEVMTFNLVARYYWSIADNIQYHALQTDGSFTPINNYPFSRNANFNLWNFDLSYSWWFAPGSEISVLYRNSAQNFTTDIQRNMNENVSRLFENYLNHVFSISIRYFVDYNRVKNWI
jgi:hypothetical protein